MLNILVGGSADGEGWFFPSGVNGRIKEPAPLNVSRQGKKKNAWAAQQWEPARGLWGRCGRGGFAPCTQGTTWRSQVPLRRLQPDVPMELLAQANAP